MSDTLCQNLLNIYRKYMHLKFFIDSDDKELKAKYIENINERHLKMLDNLNHIDAGFDLFPSRIKNINVFWSK